MRKTRKKIGLPPGSVVFTGDQKVAEVQVHYLKYNGQTIEDTHFTNKADFSLLDDDATVDWYDIRGIHDVELIQRIGNAFQLHPLVLEDVVDTQQRPKFEEYENGLFLILKALHFDKATKAVVREQIALFFRQGLLISFQEDHSDLFESVRKRLHSGKGRVRHREADYLAYALIDNLVDQYYLILDQLEDQIESLEDRILDKPDGSTKAEIHLLKKEVIRTRKSIAPLREAINRFSRSDNSIIEESTTTYIRDLYGHTVQVMDSVDNFRDVLNGLQDLYVSEISFKMNQVMQVLTIITTIFVPLSFLAGLYGMNFEYIPELRFKHGYFVLLGVMFSVGMGLLLWFKRKDWL
ncbi:MAG: magnesium/cobalt transporter CorA [Bacteroidota bacterium]